MITQVPQYFQSPQYFSAASKLDPSYVEATIPAFTAINSVDTTPTIVLEFPVTNTANVTFRRPLFDGNTDTSYLLAVRYTDAAGETYRYVLYNNENSGFEILFPDYESQTIGASAIIEVWANPDETTIAASEDLTFVINVLTFYGQSNSTVCFCTQLTNSALTLEQQNPS